MVWWALSLSLSNLFVITIVVLLKLVKACTQMNLELNQTTQVN